MAYIDAGVDPGAQQEDSGELAVQEDDVGRRDALKVMVVAQVEQFIAFTAFSASRRSRERMMKPEKAK